MSLAADLGVSDVTSRTPKISWKRRFGETQRVPIPSLLYRLSEWDVLIAIEQSLLSHRPDDNLLGAWGSVPQRRILKEGHSFDKKSQLDVKSNKWSTLHILINFVHSFVNMTPDQNRYVRGFKYAVFVSQCWRGRNNLSAKMGKHSYGQSKTKTNLNRTINK